MARWSYGLIRETSAVLLDSQAADTTLARVKAAIETDSSDRVSDLHLWSIGHEIHALELVVVSHDPRPPAWYKSRLPEDLGVAHATVEIHRCGD